MFVKSPLLRAGLVFSCPSTKNNHLGFETSYSIGYHLLSDCGREYSRLENQTRDIGQRTLS